MTRAVSAWLAVAACAAGGCATSRPVGAAGPVDLTAPGPDPTAADSPAAALFRLVDLIDLPFASGFVARMVRVEDAAEDAVRETGSEIAGLVDNLGKRAPNLAMLSTEPVARTESSGFGWRDDPIRHNRSFHSGTDFRGKPGSPVLAAGDGVVKFCGRYGGYGNMIDIDHGGGVITRYAHLRRIGIVKDAAITAGMTIGELGSTGRTTGPHLHFEVRIDGAPVSPIAAMAVAQLQREAPWLGRLASATLSPRVQSLSESAVDPPKQRATKDGRPDRPGHGKRKQVLW